MIVLVQWTWSAPISSTMSSVSWMGQKAHSFLQPHIHVHPINLLPSRALFLFVACRVYTIKSIIYWGAREGMYWKVVASEEFMCLKLIQSGFFPEFWSHNPPEKYCKSSFIFQILCRWVKCMFDLQRFTIFFLCFSQSSGTTPPINSCMRTLVWIIVED